MFILSSYSNTAIHLEIPRSVNRYPDGTLGIGEMSYFYDKILWLYEGDDEFFTLWCIKNHLVKQNVHLVLPYIPHARMDRTENGEVFTLKAFCKAINALNFASVTVTDPHSNVSTALLDRVFTNTPEEYIKKAIDSIATDDLIMFFPDEGAMKRYSKKFPEIPYAYGLKNRNWGSGAIRSEVRNLEVINSHLVKNNSVLIVDDICSKGGTFDMASEKLRELGARHIYLYVTHCEETVFKGAMYNLGIVEKIYTTDSLQRPQSDKIEIVHNFKKEF